LPKVLFSNNSGFATLHPATSCVIYSLRMKVRQLLANYVGLFELERANVSSLEELLELPWIKPRAQIDRKFYRFSCHHMDGHFMLVSEPLEGACRVEALVSGDDAENIMNPLPVWSHFKISPGYPLTKAPATEQLRASPT
jgi:hypothetical protein